MVKKQLWVVLAVLSLTLGACGEVEDTRPGQPVKQRQQAFKAMVRHFEPLGTMLRDKRYKADAFAQGVQELQALRDAPWPHFGADTNYPPSKAKAAVWERPQEFAAARETFVAAVDALAVAAAAGQLPAIETAYQRVYQACQDCHKPFRER